MNKSTKESFYEMDSCYPEFIGSDEDDNFIYYRYDGAPDYKTCKKTNDNYVELDDGWCLMLYDEISKFTDEEIKMEYNKRFKLDKTK